MHSLYLLGLIYLDILIDDNDHMIVPPLEGFVMNRVTGDYFETLLYKIFVSMDENTNVLASGADDGLVKVWDRRELRESRPRPVGELAGHVDGVAHVTSRGDGRHVASSSKDQSIKVKKLWKLPMAVWFAALAKMLASANQRLAAVGRAEVQ